MYYPIGSIDQKTKKEKKGKEKEKEKEKGKMIKNYFIQFLIWYAIAQWGGG